MKRMIALILTGMVLTGAAWSQCGTKAVCPMAKSLAKLNLTDEQQAKIADLQKQCDPAASEAECRKKCADGLKGILSEEQYKQWEAACKPAKKKACCPASAKKAACPVGCEKPCCKK